MVFIESYNNELTREISDRAHISLERQLANVGAQFCSAFLSMDKPKELTLDSVPEDVFTSIVLHAGIVRLRTMVF
jgi:hypothetical protein